MQVGSQLKASMKSTSAQNFRVISEGMTVEIEYPAPRAECWLCEQMTTGKHFLIIKNSFGHLVSSHHRTIKYCREVEDQRGDLIAGGLKQQVDQALRSVA